MPEPHQVWDLGGTCSGSSSEQVVTSISSGWRADVKVRGVPQEGHNVRVAWSDDRKLLGWPETIRNNPGFTDHGADAAQTATEDVMLKGGCFCGWVRYEADDAPTQVTACHCSICR